MKPGPQNSAAWLDARLACALLAALALLLYASTLGHGYVFDDALVITENAFTTRGIAGLWDIFTHDAFVGALGDAGQVSGGRYRPLSVATFALEWELFGSAPFVGHLVNVLLYALTAVLIFVLIERHLLPGRAWTAFFAAALFTAHPLHTEVVANIKSRDELLVLVLLLAQLALLFRSLRTGRRAYVASLACYALALLSKETAVTYVALVALALWCFTELDLRRVLRLSSPYLALALAFVALRFSIIGFSEAAGAEILNQPYLNASPAERAASITWVLGKYLALLVWPARLLHDYSYETLALRDLSDPLVWVALLAYTALCAAALFGVRARRPWAFGVALYLVTLSIVSNVLVGIGAPMGERLAYVPSLGFALVAGMALGKLADARIAFALAALAVAAGGARTVVRNRAWKDSETLTLTDVAAAPRNCKLHMGAGEAWMRIALRTEDEAERRAAFERARAHLDQALAIHPTYGDAFYQRACLHAYLGQAEEIEAAMRALHTHGRAHLSRARTRDWLSGELYRAGMKALRDGKAGDAQRFFEAVLGFDPEHARALAGLGGVLASRGDYAGAAGAFERALERDELNAGAWSALGGCRFELGQREGAREAWTRALEIDPSNTRALEGMRLLATGAGSKDGG